MISKEYILWTSFIIKPIIIYIIENKKTHFLTLEQCRLAGNGFLGAINSQKIAKIQVEDISRKNLETLAFVEGLALGNYQFIKYRATANKI
jgi:hypothetical protein